MLKLANKAIPVTAAAAPDVAVAIGTDLVQNWAKTLDPSYDVQKVEVQSVDKFGSSRIGFVKISTYTERNGSKIPGICLLRGGAVALLLEITDEQTGEKYSVLTKQPRLPTGRILCELPAGMLDGSGNLKGVAVKELEEECGLVAKEDDLIDLTGKAYVDQYPGIYTSPGLLDEFLRLFLWRTTMPHDQIMALNEKLGGVDEHEQIVLKLVKYEDIWKYAPDAKTLSALHLARVLEANGSI